MWGFPQVGKSHCSNKELKWSAPNYVRFRLKVELGSSLAQTNTNKQPDVMDTALDTLCSVTDMWPARGMTGFFPLSPRYLTLAFGFSICRFGQMLYSKAGAMSLWHMELWVKRLLQVEVKVVAWAEPVRVPNKLHEGLLGHPQLQMNRCSRVRDPGLWMPLCNVDRNIENNTYEDLSKVPCAIYAAASLAER